MRTRITFRKGPEARFLSHLDLMATLEYSVRRARLPVELSEGFNPRPRMSVAAPLPLGYEGEREILELGLREPVEAEEVRRRLQAAVPPGIEILNVEAAEPGRKSAASLVRGAVYRVTLPEGVGDLGNRVSRLLDLDSLTVEEERHDGTRVRDLRPLIVTVETIDQRRLTMEVRFDETGTARPEQILELMGVPAEGAQIVREGLVLGE